MHPTGYSQLITQISALLLAALITIALSGCVNPAEDTPVSAPPPPAMDRSIKTFAWNCLITGYVVTDFRNTENAVWLFTQGKTQLLPRERSASGSKYTNGDYSFFSKGNEAILETPEGEDHCLKNQQASLLEDAKLRGVDFRGMGNEPGWIIEISGNQLYFETNYGTESYEFLLGGHASGSKPNSVVYKGEALGKSISVEISSGRCNDTMSDNVYESFVTVNFEDTTLNGCGQALH